MKNKILKITAVITAVLVLVLCFAGCTSITGENDTANTANEQGESQEISGEEAEEVAEESGKTEDDYFSNRDLDPSYDESEAVNIKLNDTTATADGSGVTVNGSVITVTAEGIYVISGKLSDGQIIVNAGDEDKVQLVLDGVDITNDDSACILVKNADKTFITLAEGSTNTLADTGSEYVQQSDYDKTVDGVIFSSNDLVFNGSGSLTIKAGYKHAVVSKDDLKVTGGTYNITATGKGFTANDSIRISDGTFTVNSTDDAFHVSSAETADVGYMYVAGGKFTVKTDDDGLHCTSQMIIDGGTFDITASEGIEGTSVTINDGDITISASDDGINAASKSTYYNPEIIINGGKITISMGQGDTDAVDSNGSITVNGGTIYITAQSAFDYETTGTINGGTVTVNGEQITEMTNQMMGGGMPGKNQDGMQPGMEGDGQNGFSGKGPRGGNGDSTGSGSFPGGERPEMPDMSNQGDMKTPPDMGNGNTGNPGSMNLADNVVSAAA